MQQHSWYQQNKNKWWFLPLILPAILLPLSSFCNAETVIDGTRVALFYLSPAVMMALVMIFGWAALPGISLAVILRYMPTHGVLDAITGVFHYLVALIISWGGYLFFTQRRNLSSFGDIRLTFPRMLWLVFCNGTLFFLYYQVTIFFGLYDFEAHLFGSTPFHITALINYQAILVGSLTGLPLSYFVVRAIRNPLFVRSFISRSRAQFHNGTSRFEVICWISIVVILVALLLIPLNDNSTIFNTNYTVTLILPVMLWGAMRFGYLFITSVWTILLIVLSNYFYRYIPPVADYKIQLAITSSCYVVYSFSICLMAIVTTRQRATSALERRLSLLDPMTQLPNFRALTCDLEKQQTSVVCFLRIPGLELLGRNYGVLLRVSYKQQLAIWVKASLADNELVYQLSGHEMVIRMNGEAHLKHIEILSERIKAFRFFWDDMPLQPQVGISYCCVRHPVDHLPLLLGELSTMADFSLTTNRPESIKLQGSRHVQNAVKNKVDMLNQLQYALDHNQFSLQAQPIKGVRGDVFYEVLLRMQGDDDVYLPSQFNAIAHEFGLSSKIDFWALEATLAFIDGHRTSHPGIRFSVNVTAATVCRAQFPEEVRALLNFYHVESWQLILGITETHMMSNFTQADTTLRLLRKMGCRVTIADFGSGYASYICLREMNADIMKIDGSFIRNLMTSSVDYQIVESICQLARAKRLQVVATDVETAELRHRVEQMGIDYMQGNAIGKPVLLEQLPAS